MMKTKPAEAAEAAKTRAEAMFRKEHSERLARAERAYASAVLAANENRMAAINAADESLRLVLASIGKVP